MRMHAWLLMAGLLMPQLAQAHDYWIESTLQPVADQQRLQSRLYLGDGLQIEEEQPYKPERASDFHLYLRKRSIDLRPRSQVQRSPMLDTRLDGTGGLLRLDRTPAYPNSTPAAFRHSLEHENQLKGFGFPLPTADVRERYTRYLKSLVGDGAGQHGRDTGQRLEITLLDDPLVARLGSDVRVRIRFEGLALANAPLQAYRRDAQGAITAETVRTDADGQARFKLDGKGLWLLRMMHLRPCAQACAEVQWESFWAAYAFRR